MRQLVKVFSISVALLFCKMIFPGPLLSEEPGFSSRQWQQDVTYVMNVQLIDSLRTWAGTVEITYTNNSPDTLAAIWLRLPTAALRGGSKVDQTFYRNDNNRFSRVREVDWGNLVIKSASSSDREVEFVQDGSIGRLIPASPILPGGEIRFQLEFETLFPTGGATYRTGYSRGQYKGAYWYPTVCPYTPSYGWTVNRYFGTAEAYGEIANYTIRYIVPYDMIVASTGYLENESEVLPPERLNALSLESSEPRPVRHDSDQTLTWIYHAENVPDVAFAADRDFLIERIDFGHFESWSFVRRGREEAFADAAEIAGWTIQQLEDIYGPYPWPRVNVTDSWSAMEYPMLTMMSGSTPGYQYVLIHEVVHNYTPMIIHSNSADAPVLDEGFTTFIEHELSARFAGTRWDRERTITRGLFSRELIQRDDEIRGRRPYMESVLDGEDLPMVRGADTAEDYPQLRVSTYYKTPVMLNTLRQVIGEDAFWDGFREYYRIGALHLVDELDMVQAFENSSRRPLSWFFQQFLYDDGDVDYSIDITDSRIVDDSVFCSVKIERIGDIRLPQYMGIIAHDGDTLFVTIPFLETDPVPAGYEAWGYWDQLHDPATSTTVSLALPLNGYPYEVVLDPYQRYTDRDPLNNRFPRAYGRLQFDPLLVPISEPPLESYRILWSPSVGYDVHYGFLPGIELNGSYMERLGRVHSDIHIPVKNIDDGIGFRFGLSHPLSRGFHPVSATVNMGQMHADRWMEAGFDRSWRIFRPRWVNFRTSIAAGTWERNPAAVCAIPLNETHEMDMETIPYFRFTAEAGYSLASTSFRHTGEIVHGTGDHGFTGVFLENIINSRLYHSTRLVFETRAVYTTHQTPQRFRPGLRYGSEYNLRGHPLYGGAVFDNPTAPIFPMASTIAALSCDEGVESDRFVALKLATVNRLPRFIQHTGWDVADRLTGRFRYGVYQAGALYHDAANVESTQTGIIFESGLQVSLLDLYGMEFTIQGAFLNLHNEGYSEWETATILDWTKNNWGQFVCVRVNLLDRGLL